MPGKVAVVRLSAIGDTLIAARTLSLLVKAGLDPVFFTYPASLAVARLVPGLRWIGVVEKDGSFVVRGLEGDVTVPDYRPHHVLDLQCTARSRRVVQRLTTNGGVRIWKAPKRTSHRLWLILRARLRLRQMARVPEGGQGTKFAREAARFRMATGQGVVARALLSKLDHSMPSSSMPFSSPPMLEKWGLASRRYVVLFPGASAPLKAWGAARFRELLRRILEGSCLDVAILGGPDECSVADEIFAGSGERVRNLAGKASLEESLSLLGNAAYVVTGDSFPAHACDLLAVPATVIFGATTPEFGFAPDSPLVTMRYAFLSCSPCSRHGRGTCRFGNLRCMELVTVEDVFGDLMRAGVLSHAEARSVR